MTNMQSPIMDGESELEAEITRLRMKLKLTHLRMRLLSYGVLKGRRRLNKDSTNKKEIEQ